MKLLWFIPAAMCLAFALVTGEYVLAGVLIITGFAVANA